MKRSFLLVRVAALLLVTLSVAFAAESAVLRVKPGGTGDGSSWEKALGEEGFIAKLSEAVAGYEFWLAAGRYRPAVVSEDIDAEDPPALDIEALRESSFVVGSGVSLYGGFTGTEIRREQRSWETNVTVLSGRIDTLLGSVNSYSVVVVSGDIGAAPTIDGFTIADGIADGPSPHNKGGGMRVEGSSPNITNCTFSGNEAERGGALSIAGGAPVIRDSVFSNNTAVMGGALFSDESAVSISDSTFSRNNAQIGGGIFFNAASTPETANTGVQPTIADCAFTNNTAAEAGGALTNWHASPSISGSTFSSNRSSGDGGAVFNRTGTPTFTASTFSANRSRNGGAMANWDASPIVVNCTFSGNRADANGGAMLNDASSPVIVNATITANRAATGGGLFNFAGSPVIANSILWNNGTETRAEGGATTITYSIVQGGFAGEGNIDEDPLLGTLANYGGTTYTHSLDEKSPAIDSGLPVNSRVSGNVFIPAVDQRGISRPRRSGVDIGAYEFFGPDDPPPSPGGGGGSSFGCSTGPGSAGVFLLLVPLVIHALTRP